MAIIRDSQECDVVSYVNSQLDNLFFIKPEAWGTHIRGKKKRIDMIIYPKQELIEQNFPKIPIGIEIKTNSLVDGNKKQVIELYHQAITYRHTRFQLKTGNHFLPMILIYPPMDNYLKDAHPEFIKGFKYIASRLAGLYFIGELFLERDCEDQLRIDLCGSTYYRLSNGTGKRHNLNWGFERYEEQKSVILKQKLSPKDYNQAIDDIAEMIGL